jgi:hypothetical protein
MIPMQDYTIQYQAGTNATAPTWHPISVAAAAPYLKALGLVTTLLIAWASLCSV